MNQALKKTCAYYKNRNDLLSFVKKVQEKHGQLSPEIMKDIASLWDVSVGEIYGLVTFYSFLSTQPTGRNVLRVCKSTSCWLRNYQSVIKTMEKELGIKPGQTTGDRKFSLQRVNCIGACDHTPAMMVNDEVYSGLTPEKVKTILRKCDTQHTSSVEHSSS